MSASPKVISGIEARNAQTPLLSARFARLASAGTPIGLAIIQVGDRSDSAAYIRSKSAYGKKLGVPIILHHLPATASQTEILCEVEACNADRTISGIIVQLPFPAGIDSAMIVDAIDPRKDIDGLTSANAKIFYDDVGMRGAVIPATARGVIELLAHNSIDIRGKKVTVVGRSPLVGKPIARLCHLLGADVTVAHRKTADLAAATASADVIIVAAGKPRLIRAEHVRSGQTVIDVGINRDVSSHLEGGKLVGDVDFEAVSAVLGPAGAITPVPGGVGPMTVLALFENLADLCEKKV